MNFQMFLKNIIKFMKFVKDQYKVSHMNVISLINKC